MVLDRSETINGIDIVLWDFDYGTKHFYSVMTYPEAKQTDYNNAYGPQRDKTFCLEISFNTLEEAKQGFEELKNGTKTLTDFKNNMPKKEYLEFI